MTLDQAHDLGLADRVHRATLALLMYFLSRDRLRNWSASRLP